jgi:hypothetical protein
VQVVMELGAMTRRACSRHKFDLLRCAGCSAHVSTYKNMPALQVAVDANYRLPQMPMQEGQLVQIDRTRSHSIACQLSTEEQPPRQGRNIFKGLQTCFPSKIQPRRLAT